MAHPAQAGIERRLFDRFDLMAQVRVKRGSVDLLMELTNISMSGALVDMGTLRTPGWVKQGRVVEIGIIHPIDLDTITVRGEIVRITKHAGATKFAVHFVEIDDAVRKGLERLHDAAKPSVPAPPRPRQSRTQQSRPQQSRPQQSAPRVRKGPPPLPK